MSDNVEYNPKSPPISRNECPICFKEVFRIEGQLFDGYSGKFDSHYQLQAIIGFPKHQHQTNQYIQLQFPGFENV